MKRTMCLSDFIKQALFNEGVFCRIDIPIKMMAVDTWCAERRINDIWWRMQYLKLWYWKGKKSLDNDVFIDHIVQQRERLIHIVGIFEKNVEYDPLVVGSNLALKDGSHRLAGLLSFGCTEVDLDIMEDNEYYKPLCPNQFLREIYTREEWDMILTVRDKIKNDLDGGKWK